MIFQTVRSGVSKIRPAGRNWPAIRLKQLQRIIAK
uniref:Uncharacterized protein n=1 Tax=Lepeophtheirus salmonis TaxID=72036 RepID=A0A0K2VAX6_LEPSM